MKNHTQVNIIQYNPLSRDDTRISWVKGEKCFTAYHEESECSLAFNISEIDGLIEVLQALKANVEAYQILGKL